MAERRPFSGALDPGAELGLILDRSVSDTELDLLCELARSGTLPDDPGRVFAVNQVSELTGFQDVVVRDSAGHAWLNPDVESFAARRGRGIDAPDGFIAAVHSSLGPALNERARVIGVTAAMGVAELVRRDDQGEWQLHHGAKRAIREALAEID